MTMHLVIGILVAVSVPLWLVVEQISEVEGSGAAQVAVPGPDGDEPPAEGGHPDRHREVTGRRCTAKLRSAPLSASS